MISELTGVESAYEIPDVLWDRIVSLLPSHKRKKKAGRPRMNDRKAISAIFYVLRTGCQWNSNIFKDLENSVVQKTNTPPKTQSPNTNTTGFGVVFLKEVNDKGCYDGSVSGGERATCRKQGDIKSVVTGHNYGIYATVVIGQKSASPKASGTPSTEITSGGPGSREGNCCDIRTNYGDL